LLHNKLTLANVGEFRQSKVEGVVILAEWQTGGFDVCPECIDLSEGGPYTLDEIEPMLPAHPHCKCVAIPSGMG